MGMVASFLIIKGFLDGSEGVRDFGGENYM